MKAKVKKTVVDKRILVLREVVVKLTQLLAGQGLEVTQRGTKAFVRTDVKTLKPISVNIPHIPDEATEELILAIQGFIDHEIGHIFFTDFSIVASIADNPRLSILHNIVEDTFVERSIGKKFPGAVYNLNRLHQFFIERITKAALNQPDAKSDPERQFKILLVPLVRGWAGQTEFQEFMKDYKEHPAIKKFCDAMPKDVIEKIPKISNSTGSFEVAQVIYDILTPSSPEAEEENDDDENASAPSGPSEKASDPDGVGSATDKPEDEEDKGSKGEASDEEPSEGEKSPEGEGEEGSKESEPDESEPDESEPSETGAPEDELENEEDEEDGSDGAAEPEESDEGAGSGVATGGSSEEAEPETKNSEKSKTHGQGSSALAFDKPVDLEEGDSFDDAIASKIGKDALSALMSSDYKTYTNDWDKIEVLEVSETNYKDAWLRDLNDKTAHMVGPMQKEIERMMAARSQVLKVPGFRSGKLHGAGLHKLIAGDDRVFRRKFEFKSKETAVTLLIDNSGSMMGEKTRLAMASAYALSQTLDRVKVPHEVLGFTTFHPTEYTNALSEIQKEINETRIRFTRVEPLYMPIYKEFTERMSPVVKKRFAAAEHTVAMRNNVDGECVEIAARRLMRRQEPRKVLIVLSDGAPACGTANYPALYRHAERAVERAEAMGVETIGIGILDDSVKQFYPKNIVLRDLEELPKAVMTELKNVLLAR